MADPAKKDEALASAVRDAFQKHMEQARQAALAAKAQKLGTLEPPKPANGPIATQPAPAPSPRAAQTQQAPAESRFSPALEAAPTRSPSQPLDLRPTSLRGLTSEPQKISGAPSRDAGDGFLAAPRAAAPRTEAPPRPRLQPPPPVNDFAARKAAADRRDRERELEQRERERSLAERSEAHRLPKAETAPLFGAEPVPEAPSPRREAPVRSRSREAEFEDLLRSPIEPSTDPAPAQRSAPDLPRNPTFRPEINGLRKPPSSIPSRLGATMRQERLAEPALPPPLEARSPVSTSARKAPIDTNERVLDTETPVGRSAPPKIELPDLSKPIAVDPPEEFDFRFEEATLSRAPSVRDSAPTLRAEPLGRPLRSLGTPSLAQTDLANEPVARSASRTKAFPDAEPRLENTSRAKPRRATPAPKETESPFASLLTRRNSLYVVAGLAAFVGVAIVGALLLRGPIAAVNPADEASAPAAQVQSSSNGTSSVQQLEPVTATPSRGIAQTVVTRSVKTTSINLDQIDVAIQDARERTASGDVARARLMLAGLQNTGDARVLMAMAETFDPALVRDPGTADPRQALRFYEAAQQAGMPGAADRVARLAAQAN